MDLNSVYKRVILKKIYAKNKIKNTKKSTKKKRKIMQQALDKLNNITKIYRTDNVLDRTHLGKIIDKILSSNTPSTLTHLKHQVNIQ